MAFSALTEAMKRPVSELRVFTRPDPANSRLPNVSETSILMRREAVGVFDSPVIGRDDACFIKHDGIGAVYTLDEVSVLPPDLASTQPPLL